MGCGASAEPISTASHAAVGNEPNEVAVGSEANVPEQQSTLDILDTNTPQRSPQSKQLLAFNPTSTSDDIAAADARLPHESSNQLPEATASLSVKSAAVRSNFPPMHWTPARTKGSGHPSPAAGDLSIVDASMNQTLTLRSSLVQSTSLAPRSTDDDSSFSPSNRSKQSGPLPPPMKFPQFREMQRVPSSHFQEAAAKRFAQSDYNESTMLTVDSLHAGGEIGANLPALPVFAVPMSKQSQLPPRLEKSEALSRLRSDPFSVDCSAPSLNAMELGAEDHRNEMSVNNNTLRTQQLRPRAHDGSNSKTVSASRVSFVGNPLSHADDDDVDLRAFESEKLSKSDGWDMLGNSDNKHNSPPGRERGDVASPRAQMPIENPERSFNKTKIAE